MRPMYLSLLLVGCGGGLVGGLDMPAGGDEQQVDDNDGIIDFDPPNPGERLRMPLISRDVPAFASSGDAASANDSRPNVWWHANALPAWLALDISSVPEADRHNMVVAIYAAACPDFMTDGLGDWKQQPHAYTVETHTAPGGGTPPTDGWTERVRVSSNVFATRVHLIDGEGAHWLRVMVTESSAPSSVAFDLDVYSAPQGPSDALMLMGDSITFMATTYAFSNLPALVEERAPERWPLIVPAARGGTNTSTALTYIDAYLAHYPGRYVGLAYGTNDHAREFHMEELVNKVFAAGKVPVVPRMPWSPGSSEGVAINQQIDALYSKYPDILRGPDLWAAFEGRTDLVPEGNVHPTSAGQEVLRQKWADVIGAQ